MKINKTILSVALLALCAGQFVSCTDGDDFNYDKKGLLVTGTEKTPLQVFSVEDTPASYPITISATKKAEQDINVSIAIDGSLVEAYNAQHGTSYYAIPDECVQLTESNLKISAGQAVSTASAVKVVSTESFVEGRTYVIPVTIKSISGGAGEEVVEKSRTIYLKISRVIQFHSLENQVGLASIYTFPADKMVDLTNYTIEFKFYSESFGNEGDIKRVLSIEGDQEECANMFRFGENGSGSGDNLQWVNPGGGKIFSNTHFLTNRWYMVSCTYDGSTFKMYVDGVQDTELAGAGKHTPFQWVELGMSWTDYYRSAQFFKGRLAEVRVWKRALTSSEISTSLCSVDKNSEGLVAYWKMNQESGPVIKDECGNYDMDWSNTQRVEKEWGPYVEHNEANGNSCAGSLKFIIDEKNKCAQ